MITAEEARKAANRVKAELKERTLKDVLFFIYAKIQDACLEGDYYVDIIFSNTEHLLTPEEIRCYFAEKDIQERIRQSLEDEGYQVSYTNFEYDVYMTVKW